jgi:hypothetical protein
MALANDVGIRATRGSVSGAQPGIAPACSMTLRMTCMATWA